MGELEEILNNTRWLLDALDVALVAFMIYRIILLIKGTRAVQMVVGLAVVLAVYVISEIANLYTLQWLLDNFLTSIVLVIVVIFQNDIRRALMHVGRNPFFADVTYSEESKIIDELVTVTVSLASKKI
ncbi:MAG: TIGR00159 family protein, partial [Desulfuromonas sp.]